MDSIFLGTGASEGIPAPFCDCPTCTYARENGGIATRTRCSFLIDEENLIDYGPDIRIQSVQNNINFRNLKNIFITHSHEDHIAVADMFLVRCRADKFEGKIRVYGTQRTLKQMKDTFPHYIMPGTEKGESIFEKHYELIPLEAYKTYEIGGMNVTPIHSSHYGYGVDELGFNYIIKNKQGKTFLYASDTGWYRSETWEYLKNSGIKFDFVISECTYGDLERPDYDEGHLDFKNLKFMLSKLTEYQNIDYRTPIYITHICHLNTLNHNQMLEFFDGWEWNITPAYDGLKISNN